MIGSARALLFARSMCSSMRWNSATSGSMASNRHRQRESLQLRITHSLFNLLRGQMRDPAIPEMDEPAVQTPPIDRAVGLQKALDGILGQLRGPGN